MNKEQMQRMVTKVDKYRARGLGINDASKKAGVSFATYYSSRRILALTASQDALKTKNVKDSAEELTVHLSVNGDGTTRIQFNVKQAHLSRVLSKLMEYSA